MGGDPGLAPPLQGGAPQGTSRLDRQVLHRPDGHRHESHVPSHFPRGLQPAPGAAREELPHTPVVCDRALRVPGNGRHPAADRPAPPRRRGRHPRPPHDGGAQLRARGRPGRGLSRAGQGGRGAQGGVDREPAPLGRARGHRLLAGGPGPTAGHHRRGLRRLRRLQLRVAEDPRAGGGGGGRQLRVERHLPLRRPRGRGVERPRRLGDALPAQPRRPRVRAKAGCCARHHEEAPLGAVVAGARRGPPLLPRRGNTVERTVSHAHGHGGGRGAGDFSWQPGANLVSAGNWARTPPPRCFVTMMRTTGTTSS
mmetsp:Transcript_5434/g.16186  ORF Transcript_5434/g.16186 Transcript_5434/m.16186 type:complete len:310 (-) Transcript_5434:210-1139(-)